MSKHLPQGPSSWLSDSQPCFLPYPQVTFPAVLSGLEIAKPTHSLVSLSLLIQTLVFFSPFATKWSDFHARAVKGQLQATVGIGGSNLSSLPGIPRHQSIKQLRHQILFPHRTGQNLQPGLYTRVKGVWSRVCLVTQRSWWHWESRMFNCH